MDAKAIWKQGMSFDGTATSGFTIPMGTSAEFGGADDGLRPIELVLVGLAGCTAMDVISILQKKRQEVSGFEVRAHADRATEHPKVFTAIEIRYLLRGRNIDPAAVQRAIELSESKYCPAQAMLSKVAPISLAYEIVEDAAALAVA